MCEERYWMKKPCEHCPYSRKVDFNLHPVRAEEFAIAATNTYNSFPCHKTADVDEDDPNSTGEFVYGENSFECNGFLSLQVNEGAYQPDGFEPHEDAFSCHHEMADKYYDEDLIAAHYADKEDI